jgi:hypothetical protein
MRFEFPKLPPDQQDRLEYWRDWMNNTIQRHIEAQVMTATDQLKYEITNLSPKEGDVLVIKIPSHTSPGVVAQIQRYLGSLCIPCDFLLIPDDYSVQLLPEGEMERLGWVKVQPSHTVETK